MISENKRIALSIILGTMTIVVSMLTSIFFTPFLLEHVGDEEYGLKTMADSFVSFATIFTAGMSSVFIRFHKKYGLEEEGKVLGTFLTLFLVLAAGVIVFGLVLLGLTSAGVLLSSDLYTQDQIYTFAIILSISILFTALSVVLGIFKYYDESNKLLVIVRLIDFGVTLAYPLISIPLVLGGTNMIGVTIVYSAVHLTGYLLYSIFAIRERHLRRTSGDESQKIKPSLPIFKEIIAFAMYTILITATVTLNNSIDKIVLGVTIGSASVTIYQLSSTLNQVLLSVSSVIYSPFIPTLTEALVSDDQQKVQSIFDKASAVLSFLCFSILFGFIFAGQDFVLAWVGEEKREVYFYTVVIFSAWPIYCIARFSDNIARCANKPKIPALIFVAGFIIHICLTLSLLWLIGIWACFIGLAASMVFISISFLIFNKKVLNLRLTPVIIVLIKFVICGALTLGVCYLMDRFVLTSIYPTNQWLLTISKCMLFLVFWVVFLIVFFWKWAKQIVKSIFIDEVETGADGEMKIHKSFVTKVKEKLLKKKK